MTEHRRFKKGLAVRYKEWQPLGHRHGISLTRNAKFIENSQNFGLYIVFRIENGKAVYPKGFSGRFELQDEGIDLDHLPVMTAATLVEEPDSTRSVLLSAKKIEGNYYYADWWEMEDYQASINYEKTIGEAIRALEKLYDAKLLLVWKPDEETPVDEIEILYASEALGTPETLTDLGVTKENLTSETANLTIGKKIYAATYEELPCRFWHTFEVLFCININTIVLPTIAIYS